MAGAKPFFLTGSNAKIKVNGRTMAFCTDIQYSVVVNHVEPQLLGMQEACSLEAVGYRVSGSFTIIKYTADVLEANGQGPHGVSNSGNGIGNWGPNGVGARFKSALGFSGGPSAADGRAYDNLDPRSLNRGTFFDIEIFQKVAGDDGLIGVARVRNARISRADFSLTKRGVATERFSFVAIYADEDSFLADFSGQGQHLL